ncbi:MAG: hypothetical protein ISR69_04590 [Gammaproteobacteria bacterium]|nr:hypothetical protein [Gammaproteobacteria bacterium]
MKTLIKPISLIAFLAVILVLQSSYAAVITYGISTFQGDTIYADQQTSLAKFDSTLGELTGVSVDVGIMFYGISGQVMGTTPMFFDQYGNPIIAPMPSTFWTLLPFIQTGITGPGGLNFTIYSQANGQGSVIYSQWTPVSLLSPLTFASGSPSSISAYKGSGSFSLDIDIPLLIGEVIHGAVPLTGSIIGSADLIGHATVTYEYTPTSEPSILALLVVGLGFARRYRCHVSIKTQLKY